MGPREYPHGGATARFHHPCCIRGMEAWEEARGVFSNGARECDLSRRGLDHVAATALAAVMRRNTTVTKLDLACLCLGLRWRWRRPREVVVVHKGARAWQRRCAANYIGAEGAAALAGALLENSVLTQLNISCVFAANDDLRHAQAGLRKLTHDPQADNYIGAAGAASLACLLKQNLSVTALDLNCVYGRGGACARANVLEKNMRAARAHVANFLCLRDSKTTRSAAPGRPPSRAPSRQTRSCRS